jgi:hypothetical protein
VLECRCAALQETCTCLHENSQLVSVIATGVSWFLLDGADKPCKLANMMAVLYDIKETQNVMILKAEGTAVRERFGHV